MNAIPITGTALENAPSQSPVVVKRSVVLLTADEIQASYGVDAQVIYSAWRMRSLRGFLVSGMMRTRPIDVEQWMQETDLALNQVS